jgi:hypothetical protein
MPAARSALVGRYAERGSGPGFRAGQQVWRLDNKTYRRASGRSLVRRVALGDRSVRAGSGGVLVLSTAVIHRNSALGWLNR